jgi:D-alanyl-D-alanine carboxypeptidase
MLRVGSGAPNGLRLVVCSSVAALLTFTSSPSGAAPYSDIVVDANSGKVLHETNPDARRHPASLTKVMTLYLLFEQLEAGKLKLDSQLKVSHEAAGQSPTKLGLKPGSTLQVEDAIKGMVTRSANDAAVVVAEALAGDEEEFAKLMTRKAQSVGMTHTVYKNASGLPDDDQVTTARDQAVLGRAIQERFPRYYKYFSIRSFTFRGQSIGNHNNLLGRLEGVDGIKTGYIGASGFNLVTSVHRGNRYLVAVVMGGSSASSRDARMRELISDKIAQAATKRTAPLIAEATPAATVASSEPISPAKSHAVAEAAVAQPVPKAERVEKKSEPKAERRYAVASAASAPVRVNPPAGQATASSEGSGSVSATSNPLPAVGSAEPLRPVMVKTLTVRAGTPKAANTTATPFQVGPAVKPVEDAPPAGVPVSTAPELPNLETTPTPSVKVASAAPSAPVEPAPEAAKMLAAQPSPPPAPKPQTRSGWIIQVGAYHAEQEAKQRLSAAQSKASKVLTGADPFTETIDKGGTTYYRARFAGLDKDKAEAACKYLKRNDFDCVTFKN